MATRGNTLSFGKNVTTVVNSKIAGGVFGQRAGTTYQTVGGGGTFISQCDEALFSFDAGVFTCVKAGNYTTSLYARGCYNSSGNAQNARYRMYKNETLVKSGTADVYGSTATYSADYEVGDTFYVTASIASGSTNINCGYILYDTNS